MNIEKLYSDKNQDYFNQSRDGILAEIKKGPNVILEIGSGAGGTAKIIRSEGKASQLIGVEINQDAAKLSEKYFDKVFVGNIEEMELGTIGGSFDYIIMGDVIEHLIDPWSLIGELKELLKSDGCIIAMIPNVQNLKVVVPLLCGDWAYGDWGLLDKGHLRFFTKKTMINLFELNKLSISSIKPDLPNSSKSGLLNKVTLGLLEGFLTGHYLVVAKRS
jgi:SAM-dependent methyltransferase